MQNPDSLISSSDSIITSSRDTLIIYDVPPQLLNTYLEILQNTNSQLSLSSNPLALAIGTLGLLFAIATIAAGWFIFRQGRDFRERQDSLFRGSQQRFDEMIAELEASYKKILEMRTKEIDELFERFKSKQEEAGQSEDENLRKDYEAIKEQMNRLVNEGKLLRKIDKVYDRNTNSVINIITCNKCGHKMEISDPKGVFINRLLVGLDETGKYFKCPSCNEIFKVG